MSFAATQEVKESSVPIGIWYGTPAFTFAFCEHHHFAPDVDTFLSIERRIGLGIKQAGGKCFGCSGPVLDPGDLALLSFLGSQDRPLALGLMVCPLCQEEDSEAFMLARAESEHGIRLRAEGRFCSHCEGYAEPWRFIYYRDLAAEVPQAAKVYEEWEPEPSKEWSGAKWITSKYKGICESCAEPVNRGSRCLWKQGVGVLCETCAQGVAV
jgi:hypothetical protein